MNQDSTNNLLNFLTKKSLFTSGANRRKQSRTPSRQKNLKGSEYRQQSSIVSDKKSITQVRNIGTQSPKPYDQGSFIQSGLNIHNKSEFGTSAKGDHHDKQSKQATFSTRFGNRQIPAKRQYSFKTEQSVSLYASRQKQQLKIEKPQQKLQQPIFYRQESSHAFESAHIQSKQCLQNLSTKLKSEISNLNYKLDDFHQKMIKNINRELRDLQESIHFIVRKVFKDYEKNLNAYLNEQRKKLAGDLISMKNQLHEHHQKIEEMRISIDKPEWRKTAGQLLASDIQTTVTKLIKKSHQITVEDWTIGKPNHPQLHVLQGQIKQIVTLSFLN